MGFSFVETEKSDNDAEVSTENRDPSSHSHLATSARRPSERRSKHDVKLEFKAEGLLKFTSASESCCCGLFLDRVLNFGVFAGSLLAAWLHSRSHWRAQDFIERTFAACRDGARRLSGQRKDFLDDISLREALLRKAAGEEDFGESFWKFSANSLMDVPSVKGASGHSFCARWHFLDEGLNKVRREQQARGH